MGEVSGLRNAAGSVCLPGETGYDGARTTWSLAADLRPAAVVYPTSEEEVSAVLRAAADAGLRVTPVGTGHNAHPFRDLSDTVMLRMERLRSFVVSPERKAARVSAGTLWLPVVQQAAEYGLAGLHGSAPDVSVVGYAAGGGLSCYGRRYGLAANHVTAAELVLADGTQVRVDAGNDSELFWAVRGGGGNFGVITALEFGLQEFDSAYAGWLAWDLSRAEEVLSRWLEWTADAPESVTTAYRHLRFPPIPGLPEPFAGRNWVMVDGAVLADDEAAARILAPLRELKPELDTFGRVPAPVVSRIHLDPEEPTPGDGTAELLDALPPAAVAKLIEAAGPEAPTQIFSTELRQLGGALGRPAAEGGALSYLDAAYLMSVVGIVPDPALQEAVRADAETVAASLTKDYSRGRIYTNFQQKQTDTSRAFEPSAWERLVALRKRVDPAGVLRANHEIA
ncbi:FAD-binding oxidoreductase [Actinoplanes sp. CA-142083]|uniref:FAD-binding oxidoreductase n=1 Tax=Actinoplanes sp. CA-142083 TaxID=3239903 RepID=UPI003D8D0746